MRRTHFIGMVLTLGCHGDGKEEERSGDPFKGDTTILESEPDTTSDTDTPTGSDSATSPDSDDSGMTTDTSIDTDTTTGGPTVSYGWLKVSAGREYACGIRFDQTLECWGNGGTAQPPTGTFVDLAVDYHDGCAVGTDGEVQCWGAEPYVGVPPKGPWANVQCGGISCVVMDSSGNLGWWGSDYENLNSAPMGTFLAFSLGNNPDQLCGVRDTGEVSCWEEDGTEFEPVAGSFVSVEVGSDFGCALDAFGEATCWSENSFATSWGLDKPATGPWLKLAFQAEHDCGVRSGGVMECWGRSSQGDIVAPVGVFSDVTVGVSFNCAVTESGDAECWGDDSSGQCDIPP